MAIIVDFVIPTLWPIITDTNCNPDKLIFDAGKEGQLDRVKASNGNPIGSKI